MIGKILGDRYEILEEIGNGGMAVVYKAKCRKLNRVVAIKVLKDEYKVDEEFVKKFNRESQAAASLTHPNIVSVFDVGHDDDIYYIVMELVEGITLKEYIKDNQKMNWRTALKFSMQICSALAHAHRNGIIHRDIKPLNIILSKEENCKVTDFGIACVANMNETRKVDEGIIGSVHYISPEQAKGIITDERSDIYSLGITMYEMLTGVLPFDGDNAVSVAVMQINAEPKPIKDINIAVPLSFVEIVKKAMNKDINLRYQSANEMYKDLYALSNEPDVFVVEKEEPKDDMGETKIISKEEVEEIKNKSNDEPREIVIPLKKENEEENLSVNEENEEEEETSVKGFIKNFVQSDNKKDKIAIIVAIIISLLMIGTVITISVGVLLPNGIISSKGENFEIPYLVGKQLEEVKKQYENKDFTIVVDHEEINDEYKKGVIISQGTGKGMEVKLPYTIHVTVSKGSKELTIENLRGQEVKQAKMLIKDKGLVCVEYTEFSDEVEKDYVIKQHPLPDTPVALGDEIFITVSKGPRTVPYLLGMTKEEAQEALKEYELILGNVREEENDAPEGKIIEQGIEAGTEIKKDTKVSIVISKGKKTTESDRPSVNNDLREYVFTHDVEITDAPIVVEIKMNDETIFKEKITSSKTISKTIKGKGENYIAVYYDGVIRKTKKINI